MFTPNPLLLVAGRPARALAAALTLLTAALFLAGSSAAVEPRPAAASASGFDNPYAQPLDALGGETLAQYLLRHHEARLALR